MVDSVGGRARGSVRDVGTSLLALVSTRLELAGVELREEAVRATRLLIAAVVAAILLAACLVLVGVLLLVAYWDTHRLLALGSVTVLYAAVGAGVLYYMLRLVQASVPFTASVAEIKADLELLRQQPAELQ